MKKLTSSLRGRKYIAFLDFEGTQFSHEMIAIGAQFVSLDKHGKIKKRKEPFKLLVRSQNKVGSFVTNLTGITDSIVAKEGVTFETAMRKLKQYIGINFTKCMFVTYGNHDMRILNQSIAHNFSYPKDICSQIQHFYLDFAALFAEFVRDANGNTLSLIHACELYGAPLYGKPHDPEADAVNLANLYDAFVEHTEITLEEYKKAVLKVNKFPDPISRVIRKLSNGESITPEEYELLLKDYLS